MGGKRIGVRGPSLLPGVLPRPARLAPVGLPGGQREGGGEVPRHHTALQGGRVREDGRPGLLGAAELHGAREKITHSCPH